MGLLEELNEIVNLGPIREQLFRERMVPGPVRGGIQGSVRHRLLLQDPATDWMTHGCEYSIEDLLRTGRRGGAQRLPGAYKREIQ